MDQNLILIYALLIVLLLAILIQIRKMDQKNISKTGIALCIVYAIIIAVSVGYAFWGKGGHLDYESQPVFLQLPIVIQLTPLDMLINSLGCPFLFDGIDLLRTYIFFAGPTFILLYWFGYRLDRSSKKDKKK